MLWVQVSVNEGVKALLPIRTQPWHPVIASFSPFQDLSSSALALSVVL